MKNKAIQEDMKHIESNVDYMKTKDKLHTYYLDKTVKGKFLVVRDEAPEFIFDYEDEAREYINGKMVDSMLEGAKPIVLESSFLERFSSDEIMQFPIESTPKGIGPDLKKDWELKSLVTELTEALEGALKFVTKQDDWKGPDPEKSWWDTLNKAKNKYKS